MTAEVGGADRAVISFVVPREGGASSTPGLLGLIIDAGGYWITRFRG
jgi:hypothetical protein